MGKTSNREINTGGGKFVGGDDNSIIIVHTNDNEYLKPNNGSINLQSQNVVDNRIFYLDKWNQPMFLSVDDDMDMTLEKVFVEPECIYNTKMCDAYNILQELHETKNRSRALIILGQPGVGKTSLLAKFVFENLGDESFIIIPFKYLKFEKTSLKEVNYDILTNAITKYLKCEFEYLIEKTIILDGFDEAQITNNSINFSTKICIDFIDSVLNMSRQKKSNISLVLTSRFHYIDINDSYLKYNTNIQIAILKEFSNVKILQMIENYSKCDKNFSVNLANQYIEYIANGTIADIFRFPLILYIILSNKINLSEISSVASLYNKVFGMDGILLIGNYNIVHAITSNNYSLLYQIPMDIAFEMFINNTIILDTSLIKKTLITYNSNKQVDELFQLYGIACYYNIDTYTGTCEFFHKSIYEFFLSESLYRKLLHSCKSPEQLLSFLSIKHISLEVWNFIKLKRNDLEKYYKDNITNFLDYLLVQMFIDSNHHYDNNLNQIVIAFSNYWNLLCTFLFHITINGLEFSNNESNAAYIFAYLFSVSGTNKLFFDNVSLKHFKFNTFSISDKIINKLSSYDFNCVDINFITCTFFNLEFEKINSLNFLIENTKICSSTFLSCFYKNIILKGVVITDSTFVELSFDNYIFNNVVFENVLFDIQSIEQLLRSNNNVEYKNCKVIYAKDEIMELDYYIEKYNNDNTLKLANNIMAQEDYLSKIACEIIGDFKKYVNQYEKFKNTNIETDKMASTK